MPQSHRPLQETFWQLLQSKVIVETFARLHLSIRDFANEQGLTEKGKQLLAKSLNPETADRVPAVIASFLGAMARAESRATEQGKSPVPEL